MENPKKPAETKRFSYLAVASFVSSIFVILSPLVLQSLLKPQTIHHSLPPRVLSGAILLYAPLFAIVLGIVALSAIANYKDTLKGRGLAVIGITLGTLQVLLMAMGLVYISAQGIVRAKYYKSSNGWPLDGAVCMNPQSAQVAPKKEAIDPGGTAPTKEMLKMIGFWQKAAILRKSGQYESVVGEGNNFLESTERLKAYGYYLIGSSYQREGKYSQAIEYLDQAIRAEPGMFDAYQDKAVTLRLMGKYAESVDACKGIIKRYPRAAKTYCSMGWAYEKMGRFGEAIDCHNKAISLAPSWAFPQQRLKYCLEQINKNSSNK
jgi:tetratricopeptide (TPR) repeat protein